MWPLTSSRAASGQSCPAVSVNEMHQALRALWTAMASVWTAILGVWLSLFRFGRACVGCAWTSAGGAFSSARAALASRSLAPQSTAALRAALNEAAAAVRANAARLSVAAAPLAARAKPLLAAAAPFYPLFAAAAALLAVYAPPVLLLRAVGRAFNVAFDVPGVLALKSGGGGGGGSGTAAGAPAASASGRRQHRRRVVALTIDDGPCPHHTRAVLAELERHGARATLFVIGSHVEQADRVGAGAGRLDLGRELLRAAVAGGHELANHTFYDRASHALPAGVLRDELGRVDAMIREAGGSGGAGGAGAGSGSSGGARRRQQQRLWFRPGRGRITRAMVRAADEAGYATVLGSVWPCDTLVRLPLLNALFCWARAYHGAIIVLNDRRAHTAPTLAWLLPMLKRSGYDVVTLSEAVAAAAGGGAGAGGGSAFFSRAGVASPASSIASDTKRKMTALFGRMKSKSKSKGSLSSSSRG